MKRMIQELRRIAQRVHKPGQSDGASALFSLTNSSISHGKLLAPTSREVVMKLTSLIGSTAIVATLTLASTPVFADDRHDRGNRDRSEGQARGRAVERSAPQRQASSPR